MKDYSTHEVHELIQDNNELVVIDVREHEEVSTGKIPTAVHIPLDELPHAISHLDKDKQYIMVCRSGARSNKATEFMNASGFNACNMTGGMLDWKFDVN
ncbi:rhodanese-like domain-containing protein [Salipaludibacillus agaradhaerens]|uniref:Rhodanese-like domain-containing protein n=1 Tax=Salipaludibacillus agaradhaerens TaxID=76935 RepID=A0A9Q4B2Q4_SALAG|nr:rhodanese-like domain-containing protein [Salipaludibacillus agaradhaerens]MCR6097151.1 rhodanese-like domain-containing protein [Salipaludibacillus agaradhaerens]MCR6113364.1 rhodanese-like domain-containing protein [Salipaludibacillus agaradhaerens]